MKTIQQGASTTIFAATSPLLNNIGGVYCENTEVAELDLQDDDPRKRMHGVTRIEGVMPYALLTKISTIFWLIFPNRIKLTSSSLWKRILCSICQWKNLTCILSTYRKTTKTD